MARGRRARKFAPFKWSSDASDPVERTDAAASETPADEDLANARYGIVLKAPH
jgi:hypothetical protein